MPAFPSLSDTQLQALLQFLKESPPAPQSNSNAQQATADSAGSQEPQYYFTGYQKFLDPDHYPAIAPPWGTLNAIDLNTGKYLWHFQDVHHDIWDFDLDTPPVLLEVVHSASRVHCSRSKDSSTVG